MKVASQAELGFPENQSLRTRGVEMATIHVVGSNNDRAPWTGLGLTAPTAEQLAEEADRMAAAIELVEDTFARARQTNARAVAIFQQADMFDPSYQPTWDVSAFQPLVQALVDEASTLRRRGLPLRRRQPRLQRRPPRRRRFPLARRSTACRAAPTT